MAIWTVNLTTVSGAKVAAQNGGYACFIVAGLGVIALAMRGEMVPDFGDLDAVLFEAFDLVGTAIFVIAGFRLYAGKGMVLGSVAAVLLILDTLQFAASAAIDLLFVITLIVIAFLLIGMINGVRGARALRAGIDGQDVAETFR